MSIRENLNYMKESLDKLDESGKYDVLRYSYSLMYQTSQLEYFYCCLVKNGDIDHTFYRISKRPQEHDIAYFNMGRGYPKEMMDGHWCYVVKNMGYKMLVIPYTSIKGTNRINHQYEKLIQVRINGTLIYSILHVSDIRAIDILRLDLRKPIYQVITPREEVNDFIKENLFK